MALIDCAQTLPQGDGYFSLSLIGSTGAAYADSHHNRQLLYGGGSQLPATFGLPYGLMGAECSLGAPPFTWSSPDPGADPSGWIWWVIVATDGAGIEGSWGQGRIGVNTIERPGPLAGGASGECGIAAKNTCNACDP